MEVASCQILIGGGIEIGRYCSFASEVYYFGANHPMHFASMSPFIYNKSFGYSNVLDVERNNLKVGHDVWIGHSTIITCGCKKIGNGAVVGGGSVVTKDVPPYAVVAGNPAQIIRCRFKNDVILLLEESKWFDLEPDDISVCQEKSEHKHGLLG